MRSTPSCSPGITEIPPVTDNLTFVPGDPQLDVNKTPEAATVQPGQLATFNLVTTNNGTANLPDLTVSDPLPTGILFDDTFAGRRRPAVHRDLVEPARRAIPNRPRPCSRPHPTPPTRLAIGLVRWTFPGFDMPPNSTVTIFFRYTLEPGVTAGQEITNTMGASSPVDDLACTDPDVVVTDGAFGAGTYCTDPAGVTVTAGANFASRKWVAGNPALGWYNVNTGELVPIGGAGCLSLAANGRTYTTNPCIALVNPGEPFYYVLRVQNAGTEDALQMTIIDTFPAPGDTGVLGADRGTAVGDGADARRAGRLQRSGDRRDRLHVGDGVHRRPLPRPAAVPGGAWADAPGASTTALRLAATFDPDPLPPGGTVDVSFTMNAPADVPHVSDPTIAWNSIAHAEITEPARGQERVLAAARAAQGRCRHDVRQPRGRQGDRRQPRRPAARRPRVHVRLRLHADQRGRPSVSGTVTATADHAGHRRRAPGRRDLRRVGDRDQRRHPERHRRRPRRRW